MGPAMCAISKVFGVTDLALSSAQAQSCKHAPAHAKAKPQKKEQQNEQKGSEREEASPASEAKNLRICDCPCSLATPCKIISYVVLPQAAQPAEAEAKPKAKAGRMTVA